MGLNIKNAEVLRLAAEVAAMAQETKTEAIRRALEERKRRLVLARTEGDRHSRLIAFLEREVWPKIPEAELGRPPTKAEREEILGYGDGGV